MPCKKTPLQGIHCLRSPIDLAISRGHSGNYLRKLSTFSLLFIVRIFALITWDSRTGLRTTAYMRFVPEGVGCVAGPGIVRAKGPKVLGMSFAVERNVHEYC